ncbi:MAG: glutamate--tRNA ligase [Deltaproteobacteria bacterium]|nr:glutamate--tRNA ligase [Deltaproteobacteria bacterium]
MTDASTNPTGPVRVRIAPSPTGDPHVGTAYVALFNLAFARKHGGQFILRIEDTDQTRSTGESEAAIFESLRWLGLGWDEGPDVGGPVGPYRQSERTAIYREHAERLIAQGQAYRCFATAEELDQMRATAREQRLATSYDRRYRDLPPAEVERRLAEGQPHVVRMKMPLDGQTRFQDALRGEISIDNREVDDQILMKSDGFPTYHLANVVDDHLMGITHVIRAEEWIPSTPKHVQLYRAFGWEPPAFAHLPLLRNADKSKISKRKNPVSLEYYQRAGILPEAMLNFLARMGFSLADEREKFALDDLVAELDLSRITTGGPVFDLAKLDWLNGLYLRELTPQQLVERLQGWLLGSDFLGRVAPLVQERIQRLEHFVTSTPFFFSDDFPLEAEALVPKKRERKEAYAAMKSVVEAVDGMRAFDTATLEQVLRAQCEATGFSARDLFMMVRVAITGRTATPPLFESMEVIGKARCQTRLRRAAELLRP